MEAIHGIDTSWLHRPNQGQGPTSTAPLQQRDASSEVPTHQSSKSKQPEAPLEAAEQSSIQIPTRIPPKRPNPPARAASEKSSKSSWMSSLSSKFSSAPQKSSLTPTKPTTTRPRSNSGRDSSPAPSARSARNVSSPLLVGGANRDAEEAVDNGAPSSTPQSPKSSSFLSSALRRLSVSGSQPKGLAPATSSGVVRRQVLNVDQRRERCNVKGLDQGKLRRVAFRVDVELLGSRQISDSEVSPEEKTKKFKEKKLEERSEGEALKHPTQMVEPKDRHRPRRESGENLGKSFASFDDYKEDWGDQLTNSTRLKPKSLGQSPRPTGLGKSVDLFKEDWDEQPTESTRPTSTSPVRRLSGERLGKSFASLDAYDEDWDDQPTSSARPKSKSPERRSSGESLGRSLGGLDDYHEDWSDDAPDEVEQEPDQPRVDPEPEKTNPPPNSAVPSLHSDDSAVSVDSKPPSIKGATTPPTSTAPPSSAPKNDRPITDPLRAYRRCCQLREAPVLKRISEQLGNAANYGIDGPDVVTCLNLNKSRMQLADMVCLGDWLAIVPVKRLLLEDANLADEGLRVILAGLLAAKHPEVTRQTRGRSIPGKPRENIRRPCGVIEKLTLKNNRKITHEGWRHICLFLNMSRSITAIDISMIPFPASPLTDRNEQPGSHQGRPRADSIAGSQDMAEIFCKALVERLAGKHLVELLIAECGLTSAQVGRVTQAASCGLQRLGLASNHLDQKGLEHVGRYLRSSVCKGIDLGGNDLHGKIEILTAGLDKSNPLWALSLANCNLTPQDLEQLFPALAALPDFRLFDIAHNRALFAGSEEVSLRVLRRYLPKLRLLKRLHLGDCNMNPAQAIGLAEVIPECRNLNHINVLENPALKAVLVNPVNVAAQEEACAVYAAMMTAVRLCKTLLCVDIDVPGPNANELVKALSRQVVAYSLRNIELYTEYDASKVNDAAAALPDVSESEVGLARPDVLRHLLDSDGSEEAGHSQSSHEDLMVGGGGVAKALSYILNASQLRRISVPGTPTQVMESEAGKATAKEMSRTLLESARKFRTSLQPVIVRESASGASFEVLRRLQFLDHTLQGMIERFEHEYPEVRRTSVNTDFAKIPIEMEYEPVDNTTSPTRSRASSAASVASNHDIGAPYNFTHTKPGKFDWTRHDAFEGSSPPEAPHTSSLQASSRRGSETELAWHAHSMEEGRMHRLGQRFRRQVLPPRGQEDLLHGTTANEEEPAYLAALRAKLEQIGGEEWRGMMLKHGLEETLRMLSTDAESFRKLELENPQEFKKFRESQGMGHSTGAGAGTV